MFILQFIVLNCQFNNNSIFVCQSYVKYALSFEPDRFSTQMQLRFRTREEHGELFRVSDQHNREYAILEVCFTAYVKVFNVFVYL